MKTDTQMEELKDIVLFFNENMTKFEFDYYNKILKDISITVLRQYKYKLIYFWNFFTVKLEEIQFIHPIVFLSNLRRFHLLPDYVYENMTCEQIYVLLKSTSYLEYVPISIFEKWLEKDYGLLKESYLQSRGIPFLDIDIYKKLNKEFSKRLMKTQKSYGLKSEMLYKEFNQINAADIYIFLNSDVHFYPKKMEILLQKYKGLDEALINKEQFIYDYKKVVQWLNERYSFKELDKLEKMTNLADIEQRYFRELGYTDIGYLKKVLNIFEIRTTSLYRNIPRVELSSRTFSYFYDDVVKYIKEVTF